jgi:aminoglycoside/choline kinase family phosphotransferase
MTERLKRLFVDHFGRAPSEVLPIKGHGSERQIYRLRAGDFSCIGVVGNDLKENSAFLYFTRHFLSHLLPVPEVLAVTDSCLAYLLEDLGDLTLYDLATKSRKVGESLGEDVEKAYSSAIQALPLFQIKAGSTVDYVHCCGSQEYGENDFLNDMHSFRNNFLDSVEVKYQAAALEQDFCSLAKHLGQVPRKYFLYRDFQARNIMWKESKPYFLDYQAGRKGPLQFDVVSIMFQSQVGIPKDSHDRLVEIYLDSVGELIPINRGDFMDYYPGFVYIRLMQVLGAYGKLGLHQGRKYFLVGIPKAISNIVAAMDRYGLPLNLPHLREVIRLLKMYDPEKRKVI